jgi:hypothetical protein
MRYLFLFLAIPFLYSCANMDTQSTAEKARKDSINQLALKDSANFTTIEWIDSVNQDLGKVQMGQVVEVSWKFRNSGTKPLVIAKVTPGCGCTIAERPEEPVAPGKEGLIRAKFNSKGQHEGENKKYMTVIANTQPDAVKELSFHINITKN